MEAMALGGYEIAIVPLNPGMKDRDCYFGDFTSEL